MPTPETSSATAEVLAAVAAIEPQIRAASDTIEAERRLPPDLAHALMEAGVFRMGTPRIYGGSELDPMGQVRVVEELARIEGSVGWLSMISTAGSFLAAFLAPAEARQIFGQVESVLAGNLHPPQRADLVEGGFRVNGHFRFGSGCQHASVMACGCVIHENGAPRLNQRGEPQLRVMLVPASKVKIIDVWQTTGMRGTGSNDYLVEDVFVPFAESPSMAEPPRVAKPLYSLPQLFLVSHAGVPLGIARGALDFVLELAAKKAGMGRSLMRDEAPFQEAIAAAEARFGAARAFVYGSLEDLWATLCKGERPTPRQRATYRLMLTYSHQAAKEVVSALYDLASTSSIFRTSPLDRAMRDILTACQHRVVHPKMYRPAGRLLLGLDPKEPLV